MVERESDGEQPTLLIVDDDDAFRAALGAALARRGFAIELAADAAEAEAIARARVMEYALVDVRMPGVGGIELVGRLREIDEGTRIVVMTGYGTITSAVAAMQRGAIDYLTKPVDAVTCERALLGLRRGEEPAQDEVPSLERVEWEYLQRVLADCGGNVSDAARRLRLHRRSLQRKLARHAPRQ